MTVGRARCWSTVVMIAGLVALTGHSPEAHTGSGQAQLYISGGLLTAGGEVRRLSVVVRDADSGAPQPRVDVEVKGQSGTGTEFGPLVLSDPGNVGRYEIEVPMTPGQWTIRLEAKELPGGPSALPFARTWSVTLRAGESVDFTGSKSSSSSEDGAGGEFPSTLLALTAVPGAVAASWLLRRRRRACA